LYQKKLKNKNVNIAQVGVGYWGPNLLRNLVSNPNSNITKVVDLCPERRRFVKELYPSINVSENFSTIIEDNSIDAVVISTPVKTHFKLILECLNANKHVLVEKPMATKTSEIAEILKISKEKKLVAMVGHTFLFNPAVKYIKNLIRNNELGKIRYIYSQRLNLGRIRSDVDALWNLAPHDISIIQYWLNELGPISIKKTGKSFVQEAIDDVVFLNIEYPDNILANIHVSWLDPHKIRKMTIVGSDKMVVYDDISENKVSIYDKGIDVMAELGKNMDFDNNTHFSFNHRSEGIIIPKIKWEEPLKKEIEHFIECITNDVECITGPNHAYEVVRILEGG
tara:strand:- start:118 stop:1131 length:1014 start_codon:yes stop_codon:yes gene_type:complete